MPTLRQVAEHAGVSATAASFVLNGRAEEKRISIAVRERVLKSASELGYGSNCHARALLQGHSNVLGLVMNAPLHHRWWNMVASGVHAAAQAAGYDLIIIGAKGGRKASEIAERCYREGQVDALICIGAFNAPPPRRHADPCKAVVLFQEEKPYPTVLFDPAPGLQAAVDHLVALGHSHITYICRREGRKIALKQRLDLVRGFTRRRSVGLHEVFIAADAQPYDDDLHNHMRHAYEQLRGINPLQWPARAILCENDTLAMALITVLRERGLRVPDDFSVVGFDNLHAALSLPGLTTVSHMLPQLGARAVELALGLIEDGTPTTSTAMVMAELVIRESTAAPPDDTHGGDG